jgi:hypothetical protein
MKVEDKKSQNPEMSSSFMCSVQLMTFPVDSGGGGGGRDKIFIKSKVEPTRIEF